MNLYQPRLVCSIPSFPVFAFKGDNNSVTKLNPKPVVKP